MGPCQEAAGRLGARPETLVLYFLLVLSCLVLSAPDPGCFSSPQPHHVFGFVLSTAQLSTSSMRSSLAWHKLSCAVGGCALPQSGNKAEGRKELSAFWLLFGFCVICVGPSQFLGTLPGWSQGAVKYIVFMAGICHLLLSLELT